MTKLTKSSSFGGKRSLPDERGDVFFHQEVFQASREIAIKITRKLLLQESKQ
jgi:hypothetical protein